MGTSSGWFGNLVHAADRIKCEELTEKKRKLQAEMQELAAEEAEMNKQRELKKPAPPAE